MIEMTMGVLVLGLLALVTAYLWQDWHTNTRVPRIAPALAAEAGRASRR